MRKGELRNGKKNTELGISLGHTINSVLDRYASCICADQVWIHVRKSTAGQKYLRGKRRSKVNKICISVRKTKKSNISQIVLGHVIEGQIKSAGKEKKIVIWPYYLHLFLVCIIGIRRTVAQATKSAHRKKRKSLVLRNLHLALSTVEAVSRYTNYDMHTHSDCYQNMHQNCSPSQQNFPMSGPSKIKALCLFVSTHMRPLVYSCVRQYVRSYCRACFRSRFCSCLLSVGQSLSHLFTSRKIMLRLWPR